MSFRIYRHIGIGMTALLWSLASHAHEESSPLGVGVTATDVHTILCSDDGGGAPAYLQFQIIAGAPANGPVVSAQILVPDKQIIMNVTDPTSGDLAGSDEIKVPGADRPYQVIVNKAGAGKAFYTIIYHCETVGKVHTGTERGYSQNQ